MQPYCARYADGGEQALALLIIILFLLEIFRLWVYVIPCSSLTKSHFTDTVEALTVSSLFKGLFCHETGISFGRFRKIECNRVGGAVYNIGRNAVNQQARKGILLCL